MNSLYAKPRELMAKGLFNWPAIPVVLSAWNGPYVFDEGDVTAGDLVSHGAIHVMDSLAITNAHVKPGGYCTSDPALLPLVPAGLDVLFLTLANNTTSEVIAYLDEAIGMPFTPNGLDWLVQPDWLPLRGWFRP